MVYKFLNQVIGNRVETYSKDRRKKIEEIYACYLELLKENNWEIDKITDSKTIWQGKEICFPILAFRTKIKGPAVYLISGIHGEEPAGANAIAESIEILKNLGKKKPVVLIPLCNPLGYFRNWRYLNKERYNDNPKVEEKSVGDCSHFLLNSKNKSRRKKPANKECLALSKYILKICKEYPPLISIDLHEDSLLKKGYIYCQGKKDEVGSLILKVLQDNRIPIQLEGKTRFGEKITDGRVGRQKDSSIDELISAEKIIVNGKIKRWPYAEKVFVIEIPSESISLKKRVKAYKEIISFFNNKTSKMPEHF